MSVKNKTKENEQNIFRELTIQEQLPHLFYRFITQQGITPHREGKTTAMSNQCYCYL